MDKNIWGAETYVPPSSKGAETYVPPSSKGAETYDASFLKTKSGASYDAPL